MLHKLYNVKSSQTRHSPRNNNAQQGKRPSEVLCAFQNSIRGSVISCNKEAGSFRCPPLYCIEHLFHNLKHLLKHEARITPQIRDQCLLRLFFSIISNCSKTQCAELSKTKQ